jgi:organic radical activating enzyme
LLLVASPYVKAIAFKVSSKDKSSNIYNLSVKSAKFNVEEIENSAYSIKDYVYCFVLQPVFGVKIDEILKLQKRIISFKDARLIPQVHKYLGVK